MIRVCVSLCVCLGQVSQYTPLQKQTLSVFTFHTTPSASAPTPLPTVAVVTWRPGFIPQSSYCYRNGTQAPVTPLDVHTETPMSSEKLSSLDTGWCLVPTRQSNQD